MDSQLVVFQGHCDENVTYVPKPLVDAACEIFRMQVVGAVNGEIAGREYMTLILGQLAEAALDMPCLWFGNIEIEADEEGRPAWTCPRCLHVKVQRVTLHEGDHREQSDD